MEFSLLGAALVAVLAAYAVLRYEAGRTNAADCTRRVWDGLVTALVVGLVVGRVVAMVTAGTNPITNPGDLLIVRGGVDTIAAALAGIGTYGWIMRAELWRMADAVAPGATAALAGWHAGCIVRDACLGSPTGLPWAVDGPGGVGRHPVELYAALFLTVLVLVLLLWKRGPARPGVTSAAALFGAAVARGLTEPLRPGLGADLALWYWLGAGAAAILGLVLLRRRVADTGA